ncbi:MAG: protoheme IX farnesyltransferase [Alphaproteobacteria bacterium]|nr:protoheme IX farnesyltransferase [Alphaproteobacteria bacterium]
MADVMLTKAHTAEAPASVGDFVALLKPRVMSLVIFTALVGMVLAPQPIHPVLAVAALLCIAVGAGASAALNMWYDADIDAVMARTKGRPIPQGRIAAEDALGFGLILSAASIASLGVLVNWMAAGLLAFTIFFYAVIYTMALKRRTAQNIVIGGAAGALPPVIGWASVTGSIELAPLSLFAIIFLWTPPHFWALALAKSDDYARAGIPMLPVTDGVRATQDQIVRYSLLLVPATFLPVPLHIAGLPYLLLAALLGVAFLVLSLRLAAIPEKSPALPREGMKFFAFSILYLFALFAALLIERIVGVPAL